jgi:hypothetical protein
MQIAEMHDGSTIEFDDDVTDEEMDRCVREHLLIDRLDELIRLQRAPRTLVRDVNGRPIAAVISEEPLLDIEARAATPSQSPFDGDYAHLERRHLGL